MTEVLEAPLGARDRIVATASRLFYAEGITRVGVDRVVEEAGVAKATLYQHFRSKDELVAACLHRRSEDWRHSVAAVVNRRGSAAERVAALFTLLGRGFEQGGYRGCAFINAAAEYPGASGPVAQAIALQRAQVRDLIARIVADAPAAGRRERVRQLVMLYDGALVGARYGDGAALARAAGRAARRLVEAEA